MSKTLDAVQQHGDVIDEIADVLYGDGAWEITKALSAKQKKREAQIGYASNVVGLAAGVAGTGEAYHKFKTMDGKKPYVPLHQGGVRGGLRRLGKISNTPGRRAAVYTAGGLLGLQVANNLGDTVANRVLLREAKEKPPKRKGRLVPTQTVSKSLDIEFRGEISKMDTDKRQVFGWASVVEINGEPFVDYQEDMMTIEVIEKAAYDYVKNSRKGGNQHQRNGDEPLQVSDMIESFLVTKEKKEQMGLPDSVPTGWWVGFAVNDEDTWQEVKSGKKKEFSVHGSGVRKEAVID